MKGTMSVLSDNGEWRAKREYVRSEEVSERIKVWWLRKENYERVCRRLGKGNSSETLARASVGAIEDYERKRPGKSGGVGGKNG